MERFNLRIRKLLIFAACMALAICPAAVAETRDADCPDVSCGIYEINQYGNVILNIYAHELDGNGYAAGDIVRVTIGDASFQMPYGTGYSDVNPGYMVLMAKNDVLVLGVNQQSFAALAGLTEADADAAVTISMDEKQGYLRQYEARNMTYSDSRGDYDSDEAFANFREIAMGEIPAGLLYRSASGIDDSHGRAAAVNALCAERGIATVLNLAQSAEEVESLVAESGAADFYGALYRSGHVIANGSLGIDIASDAFRQTLALDLRQMLSLEGPFVIQCLEGKDRTGAVSLILEALMGASYEEMLEDYMRSYVNYYRLEEGDERYQAVKDGNADYLFMALSGTEHVADMERANYREAAERYLIDAGMTADELARLRAILSGNV